SVNVDNYLIAIISPSASPNVSLKASPSTVVCQGIPVTFTALAQNAGSSPTYSWFVNGIPVGTNDSIFISSSLNNNDVVRVILKSSLSCAPLPVDTDSLPVTINPNSAPQVTLQTTHAICTGDTIQFVAIAQNSGPAGTYQWFINGVDINVNNDT